jgi:PIN like domain
VSHPLKLLFDECVGKPVVDSLAALVSYTEPPPLVGHILDFVRQGTPDDVWIPRIAAEEWIIVSGDSGKRRRERKLPFVCKKYGVTHVLFSGKLHQWSSVRKVQAIMQVWDQIVELPSKPKGSGWSLRMTQHGRVALVARDA